tara:strand:- start:281 stop:5089 length:4809 start_codon:yes stop_codon:yes gene_type:complete
MGLICSISYAQQVTVDNSVSPQDLIQNTLIQGCVEVSNISSPSNGSSIGVGSYGYFEKSASDFPFENGIVLTTGNANSAGNGQNNDILNDGDATWLTDSDLETALGITGTVNATSIEFDFVSISNQIQFNYILASEEYFGNFPCEYSDGFAFLIRKSGTSDPYTNIALVPGTTTPVNTKTVHDDIVGFCPASNEEYFEGYNVGDTNYNGRTTVLSATATIQPNVQYQIKLVIADQTDKNYDSAVFIEGNSFDASVDLGDDISTCANSTELDGNIANTSATYSWFLNNVQIASANQATLTATQSGNYRVEISLPLAGSSCIIEDDVNITLNSTQTAEPISDFALCDDQSGDGIEMFDLSTKDAEVLTSVPASSYVISYHYTNAEAISNTNAINSPIQNSENPQTIQVRIEDIINGCLAYSSFDLIVNSLPIITNPTALVVCDDQTADGSTAMDLNSLKDSEITLSQSGLIVTYHSSASDAAAGINAYPMPYTNTNATEQLFVSVQNAETGCISITTLDISVIESPVINMEPHFIDACDSDHDGYAFFDLTSIIPEILEGLTDVTVTFHESAADASTGDNPIINDTNYENLIADQQIVFVRVANNNSGCASIVPVEIHTNLLLTGTVIEDVTLCDIGNNDVEEFDFVNISETIINELEDVTVEFYETENDRDNGNNAINTLLPYENTSNPQTIYITITSTTCSEDSDFKLVVNPIVEFTSIVSTDVCDENQDGFTSTELATLDSAVTDGQEGYNVSYYPTAQDAEDDTNAFSNFYTNTTNPFTIYTRIASDNTGCYDTNTLEVNVLPAPESEKPLDIILCDADRDGFSEINLVQTIPNSVLATANRSVTFHNTLSDAQLNENEIINSLNYNAQTETVLMRVENTNTGCYAIEELDIIVNKLPFVGDLTNYINELNFCEDASDGIGEFIFENKDDEALSGQTGMEVSYYLNQADADNKANAIDKANIYENVTNPQEIYVRIHNTTDESCYTTSSFTIEVGTNPTYNEPTNILVCDDSVVDGSTMFDFTDKITEVSSGIPDIQTVKFFTSEDDAINDVNEIPLQFQNTVNPQQIYVQIDNGTICQSITSFVINVISTPEVLPAGSLTECDDDLDGTLQFDLTFAQANILDIRQEDLEVSFYENFADSEATANEIVNPDNYTNTSNPQTVYMTVTNTISNCYVTIPIELIVNQPPLINDFEIFDACANDTQTVDLTEINEAARDTNYNVLFSYFDNEADAIANTNALDTNYTYQTDFDTLFVRTEYSTTHCSTYYKFNLNVNPLPIANQPSDLVTCDDDFDGIMEFDLSQQTSTVLGGQSPINYTVTYHGSELQANENNSAIESPYMAFDNETIYARIENNNTGCYSITSFTTIVNPIPVIDIENQVICLESQPLLVSANTNISTDTYLWSTGEVTPEIEISQIGNYWVKITTQFGCENTGYFGVSESETATIETTEIVDFSDPNNITVTISGIGDYLYQLDNFEPQESNHFENVAMGYHTVTIIDLNGCANVTKEVLVVDFPKFFTPNSDGDFDTWHVVGIETLPGTIINIFDRYGKMLAQINSNTPGWDGYYNGNKMPTSDYWYVAQVQRGSIAFEVKGHFTLKR